MVLGKAYKTNKQEINRKNKILPQNTKELYTLFSYAYLKYKEKYKPPTIDSK